MVVTLGDKLPDMLVDGLVADLRAAGIDAALLRTSSGPFAGVELYLPTAAAVFLGSAYLAGMAQKAGEDHYEVVKGVTRRLYRRVANALRADPLGSRGKLSKNRVFSMTYSIVGEVRPGLRFKLLVRTDMESKDVEKGIGAFLDLIRELNSGEIATERLAPLLTYRPVGGTVLVTFDAASGRILPVRMDGTIDMSGEMPE